MALNPWAFIKGILLENETDRTKQLELGVSDSATTATKTTLVSSQTANRTVNLPDASDTIVARNTVDTLTNKTISGTNNTITNIPAVNVSVTPSGNLTSTNVQAALVELQSEIDSGVAANVVGPASATDNAITRFDGTTGKLIQNSGVIVSDTNNVTGVNDLTVNGNTIVQGNLTVNGTTTTIDSDNLNVKDKNITVNNGGNDAASEGAGITVSRTGTAGSLIYANASATKFKAGALGSEVDLVGTTSTQTLTNKTLTAPAITSPTGLVKADVGLGNVDNTSDATKNAAVATLTNKTLTSPVINSPTGITKADVGLGNVDNTSDATKNSASATLTNKTIDGDDNTVQDLALASLKTNLTDASKFLVRDASGIVISSTKTVPAGVVVGTTDAQTLTNKTLTSPSITTPNGLVKGDVGLGNVDNTSDATKNAAVATLTNKTLTSPVINSPTGIVKGDVGLGNVDNTSDATKNAAVATLTNKTIAAGSNTITGLTNTNLSGTAAISNANLASMATLTIKGNNTGGSSVPLDLTVAQTNAILPAFTGDSGAGGVKGLVPAPASGDAAALKYLKADGTWATTPTASIPNLQVVSKTATYSASTSDDLILCSAAGGAFTINLYAVSGNSGKVIRIKKTDTTFNAITIDGAGSELIDGALTRKLATQWEEVTLGCDGTGWFILSRMISQETTLWTPVITHDSGTMTNRTVTGTQQRINDKIHITGAIKFSGSSGTWGGIQIAMPTGLTIDTTKMANTDADGTQVGFGKFFDNGVAHYGSASIIYRSSTILYMQVPSTTVHTGTAPNPHMQATQAFPFTYANGDSINFDFVVPVLEFAF